MHLLRLLPGSLPGRRHRRRSQFRIRHRDARRAVLRQGKAAGERRSLGGREREEPRARRGVSVSEMRALGITKQFPLPLRERVRVRGLTTDSPRSGAIPLTFPLLRNGPLPLPQGERGRNGGQSTARTSFMGSWFFFFSSSRRHSAAL